MSVVTSVVQRLLMPHKIDMFNCRSNKQAIIRIIALKIYTKFFPERLSRIVFSDGVSCCQKSQPKLYRTMQVIAEAAATNHQNLLMDFIS